MFSWIMQIFLQVNTTKRDEKKETTPIPIVLKNN